MKSVSTIEAEEALQAQLEEVRKTMEIIEEALESGNVEISVLGSAQLGEEQVSRPAGHGSLMYEVVLYLNVEDHDNGPISLMALAKTEGFPRLPKHQCGQCDKWHYHDCPSGGV